MTAPRTARTAPLRAALDAVGRAEALDRVVVPVEQYVHRVPEGVRQALRGVDWIGHPLHTALVHLPIGALAAASVMDATGQPEAAKSLTVLGVFAAIPAAAAGWSDWAELSDEHKRIGVLHAAVNGLGLLMYAGSIAARATRHQEFGRKLGLAGLTTMGLSAAIGGDLAYRQVDKH